jgi:hypothetical protein
MSDDNCLILPDFSCNDYLDGADLDYINSLLESPGWDSTQYDVDVIGNNMTDVGSTIPTEFVPDCGGNAIQGSKLGVEYCVDIPDSNLPYSSLISSPCLQQQQQMFPAVLNSVTAVPGSFISQQQQNAIVNIQQLERLTESMKRSEVTRRQVQLHRQAMFSAAQEKQHIKSMDTEAMQNLSNWLGNRIAQSKKQLQAYTNTMRNFDILQG